MTACEAIDAWRDSWLTWADGYYLPVTTWAFSLEIEELLNDTIGLARHCEKNGLDSTPILSLASAVRNVYFGFDDSLPKVPDAVWTVLDRLAIIAATSSKKEASNVNDTKTTEVKRIGRMSRDEANILVANYLKENPGATNVAAAKAVGVSAGTVNGLPAWRAMMAKRNAQKVAKKSRRTKQLSDAQIACLAKGDKPEDIAEANEAAWKTILAKAGNNEEQLEKLFALTKEQKANMIDLYLERSNQ